MTSKKKSEFISVGDLVLKYAKYWKWFIASGAVCLALAIAYIKTTDPTYLIVGNIKLQDEDAGSKVASSLVRSFGLGGIAGSENIDDEASIMASQSHMRDMIYSLGLQTTYDLKRFPFDKSMYNTSPIELKVDRHIADTLSTSITFLVKVSENKKIEVEVETDNTEIGTYSFESLPAIVKTGYGDFRLAYSGKTIDKQSYKIDIVLSGLNYAAELFKKKAKVGSAEEKSDIIVLSLEDVDKQRGKDIINKLVELYNQDAVKDKNKMAQNTVEFLNERLKLMSVELNTLEKQIEEYKSNNNLTDLKAESKIFIEKYQDIQERNTEINVQMNIAGMTESYINDPKNKYDLIPPSMGITGNTMEAIQSYNRVILERNRLLQNASENNPVVKNLDEQLNALRKNVKASIQNTKSDINLQKQSWAGLEGEMQSKMLDMPRQEREYIELERQRQVKSDLFVFLLTKMEEAQLTLASTTPKAKIIDDAYNLWKPVAPKKMSVLAIALLMSLVIPILIIYILEVFKFKISSKEELEENTSVPVLGEICLDKSDSRIAVANGVDTSTAELFRLVRTNLQFLLKKEQKVILVTSSIAGEGKSFFTLNLALSFSLLKNKKVVLVGLDIRNPKLAEYLSKPGKKGMTTYLASDDMSADEIIVPCPELHPNMSFVPAGPIPPNPSELLLSDRLDEFFVYLRQNFDYIIVDTAPVAMVSDTFCLDRVSDATAYLFRANYTNKSYLRFAETIVEEQKLKNLSIVINGTTTKAAYGYGYNNKN